MFTRSKQIQHLLDIINVEPIVLSSFDTELFGYWWYEGPIFLNLFIRKTVYDQKIFQLTTPSAYLERHDTLQIISPSPSSWSHKGFWEVWLDESNSWIYPRLHAAARRRSRSKAEAGQVERPCALVNVPRTVACAIKRLGVLDENRNRSGICHEKN